MKITFRKLQALRDALAAMPVLQDATQGTLLVSRNLIRAERELEALHQARRQVFRQHFGEGTASVDEQHPARGAFEHAWDQMLSQQVDFAAVPLALADLNLKRNPLAPAALAALSVLLTDFDQYEP